MKKIVLAIIISFALVFMFQSWLNAKNEKAILMENTQLIQQEISNVSKLIVTEGHFSEVYTYKDSRALFGSLFTADKKALVVVNADVAVAYDLQKISFEIDTVYKVLRVTNIPEPEIRVHPDFEYYDVSADYLNPFAASDYNKIKKTVNSSLMKKVRSSTLLTNAENRLLSELQKFYVLTTALGWRLEYNGSAVNAPLNHKLPRS